ncbi:hypothetical protein [Bradyrhizobium ottawaense]|uniref:Terminase n=1 Tax=Bradyrhizobium ottawaense TaxID=931866 RepID=A0ABY0QHE1_9BRAD|nr:hypothetical protein [Bradyrhizobium ottawaense]SDK44431.1 hypothetical protein SAMN05444163_8126 [Bradyrhizobium ottawaense]
MFYLVRLDRDGSGELIETPLPDYGTFEKGADAAKASKVAATVLNGAKVQCRRIAQAGDWRAAMLKRFETGELTPLPAKWDLEPIADHFAHVSKIDASTIGFIDSEENGIINKATSITPGRYLTRFYPNVDDNKRRHLIAAIDPSGEIFFASEPDDIAYVYENGPESCMDGKHSFDDLPCWPTEPYAAGDLVVAYTKNKDGRIQSRCVCWPEKKLFGRVYGDAQRMQAAMIAEGYTWLRDDNSADGNKKLQVFVGAKLLKIRAGRRDNGEFVMPYFDDIKVAIDKGDHFVTALQAEPGDLFVASGSSSEGVAHMQRVCPRNKVPVKASDTYFVHGVNEEWCQAAIRSDAFACGGNGKYYPHEFKVIMGSGIPWSKEHFEQHGEHCSYTRKNWPKNDMLQFGDKRVHSSLAYRFNDKGEELEAQLQAPIIESSFAKWGIDYASVEKDLVRDSRHFRNLHLQEWPAERDPHGADDRFDATALALRSRSAA